MVRCHSSQPNALDKLFSCRRVSAYHLLPSFQCQRVTLQVGQLGTCPRAPSLASRPLADLCSGRNTACAFSQPRNRGSQDGAQVRRAECTLHPYNGAYPFAHRAHWIPAQKIRGRHNAPQHSVRPMVSCFTSERRGGVRLTIARL